MSKYTRQQSIISRHSDSHIDEDNWINKLEKSLQKNAVQSREVDRSIFEQISSIMNSKSKYPSVQAAVDDMKNRSGLTAYLDKMNKLSNDEKNFNKKTAANNKVMEKKVNIRPIILTKFPQIEGTIKNYITTTRGNLSVPAIIDKIRSIHQNDVSDAKDWEDDQLVRLVSRFNLEEKSKNRLDLDAYNNLGKSDSSNDTEIDPSNTDAFHGLNPVKF